MRLSIGIFTLAASLCLAGNLLSSPRGARVARPALASVRAAREAATATEHTVARLAACTAATANVKLAIPVTAAQPHAGIHTKTDNVAKTALLQKRLLATTKKDGTPDALTFDREKMSRSETYQGWRIEGYWASSEKPSEDSYEGEYPFPKPHNKPFQGQKEFLKKLKETEAAVNVVHYRGLSPSRLESGTHVGSKEFLDTVHKVRWPDGYGTHYIGKYNVRPSREFYEYVMNSPSFLQYIRGLMLQLKSNKSNKDRPSVNWKPGAR